MAVNEKSESPFINTIERANHMKRILLILAIIASLAVPAEARGPRGGFRGPAPRPVPVMHHHHHSGGAFLAGTLLGAVVTAAIAAPAPAPAPVVYAVPPPPPPPPVQTIVYQTPAVTYTGAPAVQTTVVVPPPRTEVSRTITKDTAGRVLETRINWSDGTCTVIRN